MRGLVLFRGGTIDERLLQVARRTCDWVTVVDTTSSTPTMLEHATLSGVARRIHAPGWDMWQVVDQIGPIDLILTLTPGAAVWKAPAGWTHADQVIDLTRGKQAGEAIIKSAHGTATQSIKPPAVLAFVPTGHESPLELSTQHIPVEIWPPRENDIPTSQRIYLTPENTAETARLVVRLLDERGIIPHQITSHTPQIHEAAVIVAGGMGLRRHSATPPPESTNDAMWKATYAIKTLLTPLATALGGTIAASRALIDAASLDGVPLVGQSGYTVAPHLYVAVGISGQVQHRHGMEAAGMVLAVNPDDTAPIFEIADVSIIGDAFAFIPALLDELDTKHTKQF